MRDLSKMTNIEDLRVVCKRNVPKMFYEYVDTGSWTQATYDSSSRLYGNDVG